MSKNRYDTRYFEKYAMLSLQYCYQPGWKGFAYGQGVESPDLQCEKLGIGVEVTRAISGVEGLTEKIMHAYLQKNEEGLLFGENSIIIEDKIAFVTALGNSYEFKVHLTDLARSIRVKTEKLNKIYRKFAENDLYIFTFTPMEPEDIIPVFDELEEELKQYAVEYDTYFINCLDQIYVKYKDQRKIRTLELSEELLRRIKREAENV